jgi:Helix-turn-helix domain
VTTLQAFRFPLDPNDVRPSALSRHAGASRFAFNWDLARVKTGLAQREAERTYGIPEAELTPIPWTLPAPRQEWNRAKGTADRWYVSFTVEVGREIPAGPPRRRCAGGTVGVDLGVKHLAIVVEDLHVAGMKRNRSVARSISDTGMAEVLGVAA